MSTYKPNIPFDRSSPLPTQTAHHQWLMSLAPSGRLIELITHYREFGIPSVFGYGHLAPWFTDINDASLRVILNRHHRRGTYLQALCRGVFMVTQARLSYDQILLRIPALVRPADRFYLSMHTALELAENKAITPIISAVTNSCTNTIQVPDVGAIIFKHSKAPLPKGRDQLQWRKRFGCYVARPHIALQDTHSHSKGMERLISQVSDE